MTAKVDAAADVRRGAIILPATRPVATHWAMQNGQVSSSPVALRRLVPTGDSLTSPSQASSSNRVRGARTTEVTESLVIRRLTRWVASRRPRARMARKSRPQRASSATPRRDLPRDSALPLRETSRRQPEPRSQSVRSPQCPRQPSAPGRQAAAVAQRPAPRGPHPGGPSDRAQKVRPPLRGPPAASAGRDLRAGVVP